MTAAFLFTNSIGEAAEGFRNLFYYSKLVGIYSTVWIAAVLWIAFNFVLSRTRFGRHVYAVGSNIDAARLSGVNVFATTAKVYLISAFCSFVVGLIQCASAGMGAMDAGNCYEMYAVAASVIGGVSTLGGQGILLGTVIGAGIWGVLQNGLQFAGAPVAIRNIVIGVIVLSTWRAFIDLCDFTHWFSRFNRNPWLNIGIGTEMCLFKFMFLRAGIYELHWHVGLGFKAKIFRFDVAAFGRELGTEPDSRNQGCVSLSFRFCE